MITIYLDDKLHQKELEKLAEIYLKRLLVLPQIRLKVLYYKDQAQILSLAKQEGHTCFLLSETGKMFTSEEFSTVLKTVFTENDSFTFFIGPPDGFSDEVKAQVPKLSLSPLTFTHEFAYVLLLEQIYRAYCIFSSREYHKA